VQKAGHVGKSCSVGRKCNGVPGGWKFLTASLAAACDQNTADTEHCKKTNVCMSRFNYHCQARSKQQKRKSDNKMQQCCAVTLGTSLGQVTLGTSLGQVNMGVFMVVAAGAGGGATMVKRKGTHFH